MRQGALLVLAILALAAPSVAQAPAPAPGPGRNAPPWFAGQTTPPPPPPPIPADPLELVMQGAQAVQTPEDRAAAINLLQHAHDISNVRAHSYDLKTSFTSYGNSPYDGAWSLEDMSPGRDLYRWSAQGPSYSAVYLFVDRLASSNQADRPLPLRLSQARDAIFFVYPFTGRFTSLRVANANLGGTELRCVLAGNGFENRDQPTTGGRGWYESEYCVDTRAGTLVTYSPVPGLYVHYDYANAIRFHDRIIPGGFIITEGGRNVIEARTVSVNDPPDAKAPIFSSSGLNALGVGPVSNGLIRSLAFVGSSFGARSMQIVVVHEMLSPSGETAEAEVISSTQPGLDQAALDRVRQSRLGMGADMAEPGTTKQSREVIFTVEFFNPA